MTTFASPGDLAESVGTHLGYSGWLEITQEKIDAFAEATNDHQWIHVDPERAKEGPFGTTIAHGYLTLSLAVAFVDEIFTVEGVAVGVNYGTNRVRFPAGFKSLSISSSRWKEPRSRHVWPRSSTGCTCERLYVRGSTRST
jgi:hypothetical protein